MQTNKNLFLDSQYPLLADTGISFSFPEISILSFSETSLSPRSLKH